jgi:hypothetical protein
MYFVNIEKMKTGKSFLIPKQWIVLLLWDGIIGRPPHKFRPSLRQWSKNSASSTSSSCVFRRIRHSPLSSTIPINDIGYPISRKQSKFPHDALWQVHKEMYDFQILNSALGAWKGRFCWVHFDLRNNGLARRPIAMIARDEAGDHQDIYRYLGESARKQ